MARTTWLCRCGYRNDRVHVKCRGEGCGRSRPKKRAPAHASALSHDFDYYADLNRTVHGVDEDVCAICLEPGRSDIRLQRDHCHYDGGYPRGLTHAGCNARLGQLEGGRWSTGAMPVEVWLERALAYVRRSREHHEQEAA